MKLQVIHCGNFKLDGGAMFGIVPKRLWTRYNLADENNLCTWAMRNLLIEDGNKLILIDCGIGDKQSEKFFSFYEPHGPKMIESLNKVGISPDDVTDVVLTHLHFDHSGGAVIINKNREYTTTFPNARYWSNQKHWDWATVNPNPREKASFIKENLLPIQESGQLNFINEGQSPFSKIEFIFIDGHTEKQMIPKISYQHKTIVFAADILPSISHIPLPYIMSYDVRPLLSISEKEHLLKEALAKEWFIFFQHDPAHEVCTLQQTKKGIRHKDILNLTDLI